LWSVSARVLAQVLAAARALVQVLAVAQVRVDIAVSQQLLRLSAMGEDLRMRRTQRTTWRFGVCTSDTSRIQAVTHAVVTVAVASV